MRVITVAGARPNFVKIAPFLSELEAQPGVESRLVHTGQHYDPSLSDLFFEQLSIRKPDVNLGVGSGTHAEQTAQVMVGFERVLRDHPADLVVVVGDVNSTLACALTAKKCQVAVAHIEAGLRSGDMAMPEEINRRATDAISDFLFATTPEAEAHLLSEGARRDRVFLVGNIMIDSLMRHLERARKLKAFQPFGLSSGNYALATLHRPSNVDDPTILKRIVEAMTKIHSQIPILFLAHPRTQARLTSLGITNGFAHVAPPAGYLEMINLQMNAKFVITDSGGVQEETTVLGIPCLTLRPNTERPETATLGTNIVLGADPKRMIEESQKILSGQVKKGSIPPLWDGQTGKRIVKVLTSTFVK